MPHVYSAENHDWDLTLSAAKDLLVIGHEMDQLPTTGNLGRGFSCFTGSMVLSFSAIESFSASIAFCMPQEDRFKDFSFERYRRTGRLWDKLEMLCGALGFEIDKSQGLFQKVSGMQVWRNLVTHSSPYQIVPTEVHDTTRAPGKLHVPFHHKEYTKHVNFNNARKFYQTAVEYVVMIEGVPKVEPRAKAVYKVGTSKSDG